MPEQVLQLSFAPDKALWDDFLVRNQLGYSYSLEWSGVVRESYGYGSVNTCVLLNDSVIALLPAVQWGKNTLYSRAFAPYGSLVIDTAFRHLEKDIRELVYRALCEQGFEKLIIRGLRDEKIETVDVSMILDIKGFSLPFIDHLPSKRKNLVRNSYKADFTLVKDVSKLPDFYDLYLSNVTRLGTPVHSVAFFRLMLETYGDKAELMLLYNGNRAVAALIIFFFNGQCVVPFAASDPAFNKDLVNVRIYNEAIEEAIRRGAIRFDFGRSQTGSGTYGFKKQFGADPHPLTITHVNLSTGEHSFVENAYRSPLAKTVAGIWKLLPVWVNRSVGPYLRRFMP